MTKQTEALKFYADPMNWQSPSEGFALQYDPEPSPIKKDGGKLAKEALEQPAQEPVLLNVKTHDDKTYKVEVSAPSWQGLSDDEKLAIIRKWKDAHTMREQELIGLGDAFEQALKEKNT